MQNIKQDAINAISKLPDNTTMEEIMYRLYVIDKVNRSQESVKNGKIITVDELKREVLTW